MGRDAAIARLAQMLSAAQLTSDEEMLEAASAAATQASSGSGKGSDEHRRAQHAQVVALLKLDRFSEALGLLSNHAALADQCWLEKAYALYKTGQLAAAMDLLRPMLAGNSIAHTSGRVRAVRHLAAQVAYKLEDFAMAAAQYAYLAVDCPEGETVDVLVNRLATHAQLAWQGADEQRRLKKQRKGDEDHEDSHDAALTQSWSNSAGLESFETLFNESCLALAQAREHDAATLIERSAATCAEAEHLNASEKKVEMLPILVQKAYICLRLGRVDDAAAALAAIEETTSGATPNASTAICRLVNDLVVRQQRQKSRQGTDSGPGVDTTNPFAVQKELTALPKLPPNDKLFGYQAWRLEFDKYLLDLQMHKFEGVARSAAKKLQAGAVDVTDAGDNGTKLQAAIPSGLPRAAALSALRACAETKLETGSTAIRKLNGLLADDNSTRALDIGLVLTLVQLYVDQRNYAAATKCMEVFHRRLEAAGAGDDQARLCRFLPGLVALYVALLLSQNRHTQARAELARAAEFWATTAATSSPSSLSIGESVLREAGLQLIRSSDPQDLAVASRAFETLLAGRSAGSTSSHNGNDKSVYLAHAGLVAALATRDHESAAEQGTDKTVMETNKSYEIIEPYLAELEAVDNLTDGVNVNALLDADVVAFAAEKHLQQQQPGKKRRADTGDEPTGPGAGLTPGAALGAGWGKQKQPVAKKRRLRKLPKDYVEGRTMDPERWLPLRDRSSYRPKGKKGKKKVLDSTQGGVVKGTGAGDGSEVLELVGGAGAVRVEKATAAAMASSLGGGGGGGGGVVLGGEGSTASKKKKGKKVKK